MTQPYILDERHTGAYRATVFIIRILFFLSYFGVQWPSIQQFLKLNKSCFSIFLLVLFSEYYNFDPYLDHFQEVLLDSLLVTELL
jgi:hypothetical protein